MNERQRRFAEHYAACGNAAQAAREAGYSAKTARSIGQRMLTEVDILEYIRQIQARMESERIAGVEEVKTMWTTVLRDSDCKTADRLKAGELLVKSAGEMGQLRRAAEETADLDGTVDAVIVLPYNADRSIINALELESGEIVPMLGAEDDEVLVYLPYRWFRAISEENEIKEENV